MKDYDNNRVYVNDYECDMCTNVWSNEDDCMCNDCCPDCGSEVEPFNSTKIEG